MQTIRLIGAGHIGSQLARLAAATATMSSLAAHVERGVAVSCESTAQPQAESSSVAA